MATLFSPTLNEQLHVLAVSVCEWLLLQNELSDELIVTVTQALSKFAT